MGKKSQIALFIIIGLVLLIGIVILISFKVRRDKEQVTERKAERLMLTLAGEKISYFVDDCIKEKLNEGIGSAGFSGAEQYVKQHLDECVDLSLFEEQGYEIEKDTSGIEVDLSYSDDYVTVSVRYPITISLENNKKELLTFYYRARRTIATGVFLDEYGYTDHAIVVPSPDGRATLTIPEGTRITDSSGQQFEAVEISLTPVDKREDGLGNEIVLGNLVYVLEPSGLHFEGPDPVQFSVHYYDSLLDGRDENSLSVMTYGDKGVWYGVPTVIDSGNNVATGELTHFSKVALGSCTDASSKIFTNYLFLEDCFLPGASLDDRASLGWSLVNGRLESGQGLQERQNTGYNHHREGNLLFFYEGSDLEHLGCYQEDGKWVYSSYQAVGGMGMLTFSFAPGSCIDQNSGHITITADNIIDLVEAGYVDSNGIVLEKATKQVNNNQITLTLADILQGNELFDDSYLNYIAVHVLNTEDSTDNNIGTARIWADISIEGTGFSLDSAANPEGVSPGLACSGDNAGRWCGEGRVCLSYDAEGPDYFGSDPAGYVCTGAGADTECPTMSALGLVGDCARQNGQPHCWLEDDAWVRDSSGNCMEQGGDCECVREVCRTTSGAYKVVYNGYKIADGEFDTDTCEQMRVRRQGETGGAGSPGSPGGGDSTCDTPGTYSDRGGDDCWYCYEGTWRQLNEEWSSCCGEGGCSCCDPDSLLKNHYAYVRSDEGEMECKKCQYYMGGVDAGSYNWGRTPASDPRCYEMFAEPVELGGTCPQGTDENLRDRVETDRIGGELLYVIKQGSEDCTCGDSALSYYINEFNPDGWPLPSLLYCCNNEFTSDEAGCGGTPNTPPGGGDIEYAPPLGYDWQLVETSFNSLEGQCERETFYHILEPQEVLLGTLLFNSRYFAYYFCGDSYLGEYASRSRGVDNKGEIYRLECVKHDLSIPDRDTNLENLQLCSPPACRNQIVLITGYG
ncbi:hypothetical protein JW930_06210, partial [Candidatus Woesearchaeota archaeon]|nr:hypothetical protein [Candidatus Woesearchaeota archaeon]